MRLSKDQRALYAELIIQIAIRMTDDGFALAFLGKVPPRGNNSCIKDRIIGHGFMSVFEGACWVLQGVGAIHPVKGDLSPEEDPHSWTACFRMKYDVDELRAHLDRELPSSAASLPKVIESFLELTSDYGQGPRLPTGREPFAVPAGFERSFDLFNRCGYADRLGGRVRWTNKVAPHMRAIYKWDRQGVTEAERHKAEVEAMWRTLPAKLRTLVLSKQPVDVVSLSIVISRFWDGSQWHDEDLFAGDSDVTLVGGAVSKARDLARKFEESES